MYILKLVNKINENNCIFANEKGIITFKNNNPNIPVKKFTVEPARILNGEIPVYAIRGYKNSKYAFIELEAFDDLCPEILTYLLDNNFAELCELISEEDSSDNSDYIA